MAAHDFDAAGVCRVCWLPLNQSYGADCIPVIDGRDPTGIEHLCIKDLQIHDGPVEDCCVSEWREERAALD